MLNTSGFPNSTCEYLFSNLFSYTVHISPDTSNLNLNCMILFYVLYPSITLSYNLYMDDTEQQIGENTDMVDFSQ